MSLLVGYELSNLLSKVSRHFCLWLITNHAIPSSFSNAAGRGAFETGSVEASILGWVLVVTESDSKSRCHADAEERSRIVYGEHHLAVASCLLCSWCS